MTTPANWRPGDDVVVHAGVPTEEARKLFPNLVVHKVSASLLRYLAVHTDKLIPGNLVLPQDDVAACIKGCMKEVDFMEYCVVVP